MRKKTASGTERKKAGLENPHDMPWPLLFTLWREFLAQPSMPLLDRWLKQQFKLTKSIGLKQQLLIGRAMLDAMAFVQLACALEYAYQQQRIDLDWDAWDQQWHPDQIKVIPASSVWFWFASRCDTDTSGLRIKDIRERHEFFMQAAQSVTPASILLSSAFSLLWYGMRPQWDSLLEERARNSDWSTEQTDHFIRQQTQTPPLWLRPQQDISPDALLARLREEEVDVAITADGNIYANGGKGVANTQAYQQGLVEIQDLASQHIADAVAVKPGEKVWDSCAGAGGKTLAIATRTANKGVVVATDLYAYKLDELKRRAKRAQLFNIRCFPWDGASPLQLPKEVAQQQGFDWILVDAPCSSAGTWRRNPDARWRFNPADTEELIQLQRQILGQAALAVRPGGHLVYATCSWQVSENEAQVAWFLQQHPRFRMESQRMLGAPALDADTMFVAVMMLSDQ